MSENRRSVLSALATVVGGATGVVTVVRSYADIDILNYDAADMPLVNIKEPSEEPWQETTSQRAVMLLNVALRVYLVSWAESPSGTYETLTKNIRDAVGQDFELGGAARATWVVSVSEVFGEMPVYNFDIGLRCKYYLNQQAT